MKLFLSLAAIALATFGIFFVLQSDKALVAQPAGLIAKAELKLIVTNILLMLIIVVPTFIILYFVALKYREKNRKVVEKPTHSTLTQWLFWVLPSLVVLVMAGITWEATHRLDPYKPLVSEKKPLQIQVVALDWKWLFIYPEEEIATLNFVQFPEKRPIHFSLCADGSPMNSFWIPQLSGQIYAMTGMVTPLHIMADRVGEYRGRAAELNGEGYADMTFFAKATTEEEFTTWIESVKQSGEVLTPERYAQLVAPSSKLPITFYSQVEKELFDKIVMKYMHHE